MREVERGSFVNCDLTIESIVSKFGTHDQGPILILVIKFEQKKLKPGGARSSSPFFDSAETHLNCKKRCSRAPIFMRHISFERALDTL